MLIKGKCCGHKWEECESNKNIFYMLVYEPIKHFKSTSGYEIKTVQY